MAVISDFGRSFPSLPHRLWLAVLVGVWTALGAAAPTEGSDLEPVRRVVLALWDGDTDDVSLDTQDPIHLLWEQPLNYLGMVVVRHDIRKGPPPEGVLERSRAVLTAFHSTSTCPDWLWPWLRNEVPRSGARVVLTGGFGPLFVGDEDPQTRGRLGRWLATFGLGYDTMWREGPLGLGVRYENEALSKFEADPEIQAAYTGPWVEDPRNRAWISLTHPLEPGRIRTPVVTGPFGGLAIEPWLRTGDTEVAKNNDGRWSLDPVEFLRAALGLEGVPAPDPCVLNGRRVFFLHVDGDGFESLSTVLTGKYCGRVLLEEVIKRYRLPYTVSVIVGSLTSDLIPAEPTDRMRLATEILNRPDVEPASHGVLHPFYWQDPLSKHTDEHMVVAYPGLANYVYGPVAEVRESVRFIDRYLMRGDRRCKLMLWTGNTIPPEEAILECGRLGMLNMNGGTLRFDDGSDSTMYVLPWGRRVGKAYQVYAGAPNENDFNGFFTTNPGAYGHADKDIYRTGKRRIMKPVNLYIHFYIAEKPARLDTLHTLIRKWAFEEPTAPVFASTYVRAVEDAVNRARIARIPGGWALRDFGDCYTARIDGETRPVDWGASHGVLGARRMRNSLYVHLSQPDADLVFADKPSPAPHVEEANLLLTDGDRDERGVWFVANSQARRLIRLAGYPPDRPVTVVLDGEESSRVTDKTGRITVELPPGRTRVEVRSP